MLGSRLLGVGDMAREATGQAVKSAFVPGEDLADADPGPGPVQQAAHDLRQPIAAVLALASAALADGPAPERVRHRLEQIVAEAHWLSEIIHDTLAGPGTAPVDIQALVRETLRSGQFASAPHIMLQQPDLAPRYSMAASTRLRRALVNVLANAIRAAGPEGHVTLTERANGNAEVIEVVDDGPGFGSMAAGHGSGIGLQITGQILAECGGRMEIERLQSGQTLVRLLVPVMARGRAAGGTR